MFDMLIGRIFDLPEPDDSDDLEKPFAILVNTKQAETFRKVVGNYITSSKIINSSIVEFQILAKHRDEVQTLLDAHQGS